MRPPPPSPFYFGFPIFPTPYFRKVLMKLNLKIMNIFQRFIKRIGGEDKVLHFETCCLITMVVALLNMNVLGLGTTASAVSACMIAVIAGILKEVYDYNTYCLFDNKDIIADVFGAFAGFLIIILIG